jgi:hypothetical protein
MPRTLLASRNTWFRRALMLLTTARAASTAGCLASTAFLASGLKRQNQTLNCCWSSCASIRERSARVSSGRMPSACRRWHWKQLQGGGLAVVLQPWTHRNLPEKADVCLHRRGRAPKFRWHGCLLCLAPPA